MSVVSLSAARESRQPHWTGKCVCLGCRHEWEGVGPIGMHSSLECPSCELPKGVVRNLFGCAVGDQELQCNCGSEALTAYVHNGRKWVRCMACGTDLTEAFYS